MSTLFSDLISLNPNKFVRHLTLRQDKDTLEGMCGICPTPNDACDIAIGPDGQQDDFTCDGNYMMQCSGFAETPGNDIDSIITFWNTGDGKHKNGNNCQNYYTTYLSTLSAIDSANPNSANCIRHFNTDNYDSTNCYINNLFELYTAKYTFTDNTNDPNWNAFQDTLSKLCGSDSGLTVPQGGCNQFLSKYCTNFSRDEIVRSNILLHLCGCYAPDDGITSADCPTGADAEECKSCDTICQHTDVTQLYDRDTGDKFTCNATVCVIANTTIIAAQTSVGGGVNFQQVCPGCSTAQPCKCIISDVTITGNVDIKDINANLENGACSETQCYKTNTDGSTEFVTCPDKYNPKSDSFYNSTLFISLTSVISLIIIVAIIVVLIIYSGKSQKSISVITPEEKAKYSILQQAIQT